MVREGFRYEAWARAVKVSWGGIWGQHLGQHLGDRGLGQQARFTPCEEGISETKGFRLCLIK